MNRFFATFLLMVTVLSAAAASGAEKTIASNAADSPDRVEVVLYADFQCPFCRQFAAAFRELQTKGVDGVQTIVEFKNFPLTIHPNAQIMHKAAMAAREQGKFWEMHDLLFANPQAVTINDLLGYARKLKLDLKRFRRDMDSPKTQHDIAADLAEGEKLGVAGTPTFFVNGRAHAGMTTLDELKTLVQNAHLRAMTLAEVTDAMMSKGPADAPVVLEVFADFQSAVSPPAFEAVNRLMELYPSQVRLQFRNFPLAFHPQASLAHEAAMIAARAGLFWEFTNYILSRQDALREQDLIALAGRLGMDESQFAETLRQRRYAQRVDADIEAGRARGIRGSPAILVNGRRIDGVPSSETLSAYVQEELAAHQAARGPQP